MKGLWIFISLHGLFLVAAGYLLPFIADKRVSRTLAWTIIIVTVIISTFATVNESPLVRMLTIVSLQLLSMKIIVAVETYSGENKLSILQWSAFAVGWFGMRPVLFENLPSRSLVHAKLLLKGISRMLIGFLLLYASLVIEQYSGTAKFFFSQLLMLAGISFILHFGILNLSAAGWRFMGVDASELFRSPYKSKSLKEFWGKRWNVAFSEMTALIAYRPLKGTVGMEKAIVLSFLLSGVLHEIAISFPVKSGYGLPMLYFAIQAIGMHLEANWAIVKNIVKHRILSHIWVMVLLIAPMPLLFHKDFVLKVLQPIRDGLLSGVSLA